MDTSRAVLKGKIAEHIAPLLPGFLAKYNPADARFIGSPIDYLIFKNMSKGENSEEPIKIVLLDVKTGRAGLNGVQKKIEEAAAARRDWDLRRDEILRKLEYSVVHLTNESVNQKLGQCVSQIN